MGAKGNNTNKEGTNSGPSQLHESLCYTMQNQYAYVSTADEPLRGVDDLEIGIAQLKRLMNSKRGRKWQCSEINPLDRPLIHSNCSSR